MGSIKSERQLVRDIITDSFLGNPSVMDAVGNSGNTTQKISALADYAYKTCKRRNGVFLSSDSNGVALCYRYNSHKESISDYWNQFLLVIQCTGLRKALKLLKKDGYIKLQRPADGDFLYFWFFGVSATGRGQGAALELKDQIFEMARADQLPIYLETSVERNKRIYERYGFRVYHFWPAHGLYFMVNDQFAKK